MPTFTAEDLELGRRSLASVIAQVGSDPFRRQDVVEQLRQRLRRTRHSEDHAANVATSVLREAARQGLIKKAGHVHWRRSSGKRALRDGTVVPELPDQVTITIETRVPEKWVAIDCETGDLWHASENGKWRRASQVVAARVRKLVSTADAG